MTLTATGFASGVLNNGAEQLMFTATSPTAIRALRLWGANAATQTVTIYADLVATPGHTEIATLQLDQFQRYVLFGLDDSHSMSIGDTIWGKTTTAAGVKYVITGAA